MQTLFVPKYNLHYRINPKNPKELQWSRKPFGRMTQWQHAMSFKSPIRALDLDDKTQQGVVVLNDSSTYVGSGVRTWCRKYYPAGTRIFSLYAIGEAKEIPMNNSSMKRKQESLLKNKTYVKSENNLTDAQKSISGLMEYLGEAEPGSSEKDSLVDLLSAAFDGSDWCGIDNSTKIWSDPKYKGRTFEEHMANMLLSGETITLYDIEDDEETWELTYKNMIDNLPLLWETSNKADIIDVILDEGIDVITGGAIMQVLLFGEIVYG